MITGQTPSSLSGWNKHRRQRGKPLMAYWTQSEEEFLADHIGIWSNSQIATRLGRTTKAVRNRASRLHISVCGNSYSARLLAVELNRDHSTVMQWYRKGWLTGRVASWGRGFLHSPMVFLESDIVAFLKLKWQLFRDWRDVPNLFFRTILEKSWRSSGNGA